MTRFRFAVSSILWLLFALAMVPLGAAGYPQPSPYPISWELEFTHGTPKRVVVDLPGSGVPQAYWYMTYRVTNNTGQERTFLPVFELLGNDGKVIRSEQVVPPKVFERIQQREGNQFLEPALQIAGEIRLGEDEARDGVAIWPEPSPEMGSFSIFVTGLSGENVKVKGADDQETFLRKTLQLNYFVRGDDVFPGEDEVNENAERWIMR